MEGGGEEFGRASGTAHLPGPSKPVSNGLGSNSLARALLMLAGLRECIAWMPVVISAFGFLTRSGRMAE